MKNSNFTSDRKNLSRDRKIGQGIEAGQKNNNKKKNPRTHILIIVCPHHALLLFMF